MCGARAGARTSRRPLFIIVRALTCSSLTTLSPQALDALPVEEREAINAIWSNFSSSPHPRRELILRGLLTMCCFSQLSLLTEQLHHLIRLDPAAVLPHEVMLKVFGHLDATSLCRAAQVSHAWKSLADDDILWRGICEQHIGTKCNKCGWGLPVLERRRTVIPSASPSPAPAPAALLPAASSGKRKLDDVALGRPQPKRACSGLPTTQPPPPSPSPSDPTPTPTSALLAAADAPPPPCATRPWKDVYSERLKVERNWRRGRCSVRTLKGHTDGVMCLQFSETLKHPAFPILITGSYDRTARVWNLETGAEMLALRGHRRGIRALQFDAVKLVTGSLDHTLRVWNWRTGECIRTLEGHTAGVVCLNFAGDVLASGSADATIKVWNFRSGECFALRGHRDWVNAVQLWDATGGGFGSTAPALPAPACAAGQMLFSASDDGTIRLWDLAARVCVRTFAGHMGQVQAMRLVPAESPRAPPAGHPGADAIRAHASAAYGADNDDDAQAHRRPPTLVSGSLDNTLKMWDVASGRTVRTLFGHIEGVWAVAADRVRLVSGSHDRTIKVWSREDGRCAATFVGHTGAVTCLALGEDKIVSGSDDGDVRVWSFAS
jgi:F-box/WD-40 domain protein MET30